MSETEAATAEADAETEAPKEEIFDELGGEAAPEGGEKKSRGIDALLGVSMNVQVVLGRCQLPISELLDLSRGSVVELDRKIGDPVEVLVTDRLVARGELVKLEDDRVGVKITEIVKDQGGED